MSSFAITTPETKVTLSPNTVTAGTMAAGTTSYSVTNQTGSVVRARLRIDVDEGGDPSWFVIREGREQEISPGSTATFSIDLSVPGSAEGGSSSFKAVAINLADPDNDFAIGPAVGFEVPLLADKEPSGIKWWMIAIPVGLLVLVGAAVGLFFWLQGNDASADAADNSGSAGGARPLGPIKLDPEILRRIRELRGKELSDAQASLREKGVRFIGRESAESTSERALIQNFGRLASKGFFTKEVAEEPIVTTNNAIKSAEVVWKWKPVMVVVPNVNGETFANARTALLDAGLNARKINGGLNLFVNDFNPKGRVPAGTVINLKMQ